MEDSLASKEYSESCGISSMYIMELVQIYLQYQDEIAQEQFELPDMTFSVLCQVCYFYLQSEMQMNETDRKCTSLFRSLLRFSSILPKLTSVDVDIISAFAGIALHINACDIYKEASQFVIKNRNNINVENMKKWFVAIFDLAQNDNFKKRNDDMTIYLFHEIFMNYLYLGEQIGISMLVRIAEKLIPDSPIYFESLQCIENGNFDDNFAKSNKLANPENTDIFLEICTTLLNWENNDIRSNIFQLLKSTDLKNATNHDTICKLLRHCMNDILLNEENTSSE